MALSLHYSNAHKVFFLIIRKIIIFKQKATVYVTQKRENAQSDDADYYYEIMKKNKNLSLSISELKIIGQFNVCCLFVCS